MLFHILLFWKVRILVSYARHCVKHFKPPWCLFRLWAPLHPSTQEIEASLRPPPCIMLAMAPGEDQGKTAGQNQEPREGSGLKGFPSKKCSWELNEDLFALSYPRELFSALHKMIWQSVNFNHQRCVNYQDFMKSKIQWQFLRKTTDNANA